jgi:hypothetical protein
MSKNLFLKQFAEEPNLFVIFEDDQSVLDSDAIKSGLLRSQKRELFKNIRSLAKALRTSGIETLQDYKVVGILKKMDRQRSLAGLNLWEVRSDGHGGRIFFILESQNCIIVSAVDKFQANQDQAIDRGATRWKALLKNLEKKG